MGGICVKSPSAADDKKDNRRSVRIAVGDETHEGLQNARHSQSAPNMHLKNPVPGTTSPQSRKKVRHSTTTYSVSADKEVEEHEFQNMLRQFTRKSMSGDTVESSPHPSTSVIASARRGPRRDSRIDDRDVLKLLATKSKDPQDKQEIMKLEKQGSGSMSIEEVKEVAPALVERVQRRRQTMEKLDIFSPDAAPDRLEELYEATEKLLAHEDAEEEKKHTVPPSPPQ
eukprot:Gregarina_sp_Poly_1__6188@NODE_3276_length_1217_cov_357_804348_g2080_i0_p1_GENE_NODE_3276_length_1217_cov_357_804348_g2080_i0NODE_3276_length_1217_cov_357_804348_g2080_i0_p1_ORF_typecomplete_len227_score42_41Ribosomal_L26/PF16906_5/0_12Ribosomal_L26/PF16906_5/2_7e03_NODE_3276_length_1217_cov_357_804348_g2080_i033713